MRVLKNCFGNFASKLHRVGRFISFEKNLVLLKQQKYGFHRLKFSQPPKRDELLVYLQLYKKPIPN